MSAPASGQKAVNHGEIAFAALNGSGDSPRSEMTCVHSRDDAGCADLP